MRGSLSKARLLSCALLIWVFLVGALWRLHGARYSWDEVDYIHAAAAGALGNSLDRGSLSISEFARFTRSKLGHQPAQLPAGYSEDADPLILRHYHPPLVPWLVSWAGDTRNERAGRAVQLVGAGALVALIALSCEALAVTSVAGLAVSLVLGAWLAFVTFSSLSFHGWEAVWALAAALAASGIAGEDGLRKLPRLSTGRIVALGLSAAGAALTLESGAFVAAGTLLAFFLLRRGPGRWRDALSIAAICVACVVAFWPAAISRASILKIAAFYAYRLRLGHEYAATFGPGDIAYAFSPYLLAMAGATALLAASRSSRARALPFFAIGGVYFVAMSKFVLSPAYLAPALVPFVPLAGAAADRAWKRSRAAVRWAMGALIATVLAASLYGSYGYFRGQLWSDLDRRDAQYEELARLARGRAAYLDGGHVFAFYLGSDYHVTKLTRGYDHVSLLVREKGEYRPLTRPEARGSLIGMQEDRKLDWSALETGLLAGCPHRALLDLRLYDCPAR